MTLWTSYNEQQEPGVSSFAHSQHLSGSELVHAAGILGAGKTSILVSTPLLPPPKSKIHRQRLIMKRSTKATVHHRSVQFFAHLFLPLSCINSHSSGLITLPTRLSATSLWYCAQGNVKLLIAVPSVSLTHSRERQAVLSNRQA